MCAKPRQMRHCCSRLSQNSDHHKQKLLDIHRTVYYYLAEAEGFEPSHAGIKIQCLNQLGDASTKNYNTT